MGKFGIALVLASVAAFASPEAYEVQLRLETPLASYSKPGAPFAAFVTGLLESGAGPVWPAGTRVRGVVRDAHSVRLGLRRERATLALEFRTCELPDGEPFDCSVQLTAVDNAREAVQKDNRIQGILAASHAHSLLGGIWIRPGLAFLRPAAGLSGPAGMVYNRLSPGPLAAAIMFASRLILFRMPSPEIELPAGTDLIARFSSTAVLPIGDLDEIPLAGELQAWLRDLPVKVTGPNGGPKEDIVNVALAGSRSEVAAAFAAAGWFTAELLTAKTFAKTYAAFTGMKSYPTAPVSLLRYEGREPDLVFQKAFNTLAKRHHIRVWKSQAPGGETVWLGAATHDTGIALDFARFNITHRIDARIDRERNQVINDLTVAGCVERTAAVERPDRARAFEIGQPVFTDGALAFARLRACEPPDAVAALVLVKPHCVLSLRLARRFILETRQHLLRGNAYHYAYRGVRWGVSSLRGPRPALRAGLD